MLSSCSLLMMLLRNQTKFWITNLEKAYNFTMQGRGFDSHTVSVEVQFLSKVADLFQLHPYSGTLS